MRYVVYEVWTKARVVEAHDEHDAYTKGEPEPQGKGWNLCNWHVVPVEGIVIPKAGVESGTGGLNYRQVSEEPSEGLRIHPVEE